MLELPALTTRMVSLMAQARIGSFRPSTVSKKHRHGTEAVRVFRLSAREVNMMGTRAPSTTPAASALERNVRFSASMFPASRSDSTRIWARPATGDLMLLICAASG